MYPADYFSLFPPFPRNNRVFVAMSFDPVFEDRWDKVIKPAIEENNLDPYRVDTTKVSNSIMNQILEGIGNAKLIFGDISAVMGTRNVNAMYEIGMAHSLRLPEEVILFRSDTDSLPFDVAGISVNSYDPDHNQDGAKQLISNALQEALSEVDTKRHLVVDRVVENMDPLVGVDLLRCLAGDLKYPPMTNLHAKVAGQYGVQRIAKLQELGLIKAQYKTQHSFDPSTIGFLFKATDFGMVVAKRLLEIQGKIPMRINGNATDSEEVQQNEYWTVVAEVLGIPIINQNA